MKSVAKTLTPCDGQVLNGMFNTATRWLERNAQDINALNVFPVPDGDTGINMLLTMRAAIDEASRCGDGKAGAVAQAMAKGSLMGARGNSGVILSQIFRGMAQGLDGKNSFSGNELAIALVESANYAYRGVTKPVEGTILTVIREAAEAAKAKSSQQNTDVLSVMEAVVEEAKASVARTPSLLPVLKQAGVVDAGGQGLYVVLEGALRYLRGEKDEDIPATTMAAPTATPAAQKVTEDKQYGYCTEFLLHGNGLNAEDIREKLLKIGESVLVVGDESVIRVHVHTFDPGSALSYATSLGILKQVKVENMDDQHQDFLAAKVQSAPMGTVSTVAVAAGEGLIQVFYSVGVTIVVPGGETMNPSVQDLLKAVEAAHSEKVIILPNNANIVMAANQVQELTRKQVEVVPSETIPQGIAALLVFNYEADFETNVSAMKTALSAVRSGEVTTAVRSMNVHGLNVKKGQSIAFLDGELVVAGSNIPRVVYKLLGKMVSELSGLVTIYYGADTEQAEAEHLGESIRAKYPSLEVEVVAGRQPHYNYIISVE